MTFKEKLYYLLTEYLQGNYDTKTFSDLISDTFNLELDNSLTEIEIQVFGDLVSIACRFSPFEDDLKLPNVYFSDQQVRLKAQETWEKLKGN
ncbi:hypothetical protein [Ruminiclostridium papyrosolvens]|uniref:Colicin D immunity protein domain-containing protein n=1 Tax=Ruminiclostridium papyrosolvens C7 TaxID=1330534 RepID=U4R0R8_9FIRM|nr:hypothetical protein [Ruminiclostridium papyrosolvens]EPR11511.1 hypothetical protein L323_11660 [Ruminiclostridium papyrosolvens C7]